jgi:4-hydroxy-tetrahydrodipicolinate synthase
MSRAEQARKGLIGVDVIAVTPFHVNFELDLNTLQRNIRFLIDSGIVAGKGLITVAGACGEGPYMKLDEQKKVIEAAVEASDRKVPIFVGAYQNGTREVIELLKHASEVGADGAQVSPPFYMTPSEEEVFAHYKAINDSVDIGLEVYNTPWSSGLDMKPRLIARLAELSNVVGVKWTSDNGKNYTEVLRKFSGRLNFIDNGYNAIWAQMMGAKGMVSIIGNFAPKYELELWSLLERKDYLGARDHMLKLNIPLYEFIAELYEQGASGEGNPWKDAMDLCGLPSGPVRLPQVALTPLQRERLRTILSSIGVLGHVEPRLKRW